MEEPKLQIQLKCIRTYYDRVEDKYIEPMISSLSQAKSEPISWFGMNLCEEVTEPTENVNETAETESEA